MREEHQKNPGEGGRERERERERERRPPLDQLTDDQVKLHTRTELSKPPSFLLLHHHQLHRTALLFI
jgi:hypothetical protein